MDETFDPGQAEADALAHAAWRTISHLFMESAGRFEGIAESLGVAPSDLGALLHLDPDGTPSQGELARQWACDASWVTAKVDSLEGLGLVARVPDPTDRRRKSVVITGPGRRRQAEALARLYEPPEQLRALSITDLRALYRVFRKVEVADPRSTSGGLGPPLRGAPARPVGAIGRAAKAQGARPARSGGAS